MTGAAPDLTLLVPCFQEGERVDRFTDAADAWRERHRELRVELLFVDDGSRDDTPLRLARAAARLPWARVLTLPQNGGKGRALRAGMAEARGDTVLFLDADLAVDLGHVERALALRAAGADVVVGCRNVGGAAVHRRQRALRRGLGRGYRRLATWWLGLDVSDVTCGFKAFGRETGRQLFAASSAARWGFDAEVLYLARRAGLHVREMPVQWYDGEVSAVRLRRDVWGALVELLAVRWRHRAGRRADVARAARVPAGSLRDG